MNQIETTSTTEIARQVAAEIATRADEADKAGKLPTEDIQALRESGYLAFSVPQEYGGFGLSMRECVEAQLELAQASGSTAMVAAMQLHIFGNARETHPWAETYFERFCREAVAGALFNSIASEPLMGSPSRGALFQTSAVSTPDGWLINGHKTWSTGGRHLTHMLVSLSAEGEPVLMLVPNNIAGIEWVETWGDSLSLRASDSHDVYFRNVLVPEDHLVARGADKTKLDPNAWFPMMVSATYLGVAIAARDATIRYALERVPTALGKPIATLPAIQRQIGEIDLALQAAHLLLLDVASAWTTGDNANRSAVYPRIVAAKHLATETAIVVTDKTLRVAGGVSITHALPLERYFRDVRGGLSHPPSGDIALEAIGRNAIERFSELAVMIQLDLASEIAAALNGRHFVSAEFMYKPRPAPGRARIVFDTALNSRLTSLESSDAALFICDSQETINSLADFEPIYPHLRLAATITNPRPWNGSPPDTPQRLQWENAGDWRRYQMTDRWCRIDLALHVASLLDAPGYIIMPAHDAMWGRNLLARLVRFSQRYARGGFPASVSAYTYHQHSVVPGADIPQDVIDLLNTAFGRDTLFGWKIRLDRVQAFWGKVGMLPFGVCGAVRDQAEKTVWEDDLEIDRVLRELGYGVRCMWVRDPAIYRQTLPVFDHEGVRKVIERTLHYSLNIPSQNAGESTLNFPLGPLGRLRCLVSPKFARDNAQAEALITECNAVISARLDQFGASWVDWGAYRYVMRVGDPVVEVWRYDS